MEESLEILQVGAGAKKGESGCLQRDLTPPVSHRDDVEVGAKLEIEIGQAGQLAQGQAVTHRHGERPDERVIVPVQHIALHRSTDRIVTIQHDHGGFPSRAAARITSIVVPSQVK